MSRGALTFRPRFFCRSAPSMVQSVQMRSCLLSRRQSSRPWECRFTRSSADHPVRTFTYGSELSQSCGVKRTISTSRSALLILRIRALASCGGSLPFTTEVSSNGLLTCPNPTGRKVKFDYSTISDYSQRSWIRALCSKCGALTELWPSA